MRWYNKLRLVFRIYSRRMFVTLLLFGMCFVSFFMIDRVFTGYIGSRYAIRQTEKEFGVNTADAGYVHFVTRDIKQDISDKVHEYMSTLPEVVRSGYILSETLFEEEDESIQVNIIDKDIAAIGNLMLSEEDKKILENLGEDERIVFAGYNYRKQYHAGDMINCYVDDDIGKIKIGGILKKGAGWIHEDRLFKGSYGKWDNYTLDDSMIVIAGSLKKELEGVSSGYAHSIYFQCESGTFDEVTDKIKKFCYDEGITVNISNYKDEIDKEKEDSSIVDDTVFIAAIMITVLAAVSIAASNIVYCLMRRKHYGIMLANGMCKADIIWLIAMQNAIVMVLAAVAAWIVRLRAEFETLFPKKVLEETGRLYEGAYVAHMHYMPVILIISVMILLVISCVIPAVMIGRTSLADMVSGRSEG